MHACRLFLRSFSSNKILARTARLIVPLIAAVTAGLSHGSPTLGSDISVFAGKPAAPLSYEDREGSSGPQVVAQGAVDVGHIAVATAYAQATFGSLKTYAEASASSTPVYGDSEMARAVAQASLNDTVTINAASGLRGINGYLNIWMDSELRIKTVVGAQTNVRVGHQINFRAGSLFSQIDISDDSNGINAHLCTIVGSSPEICSTPDYLGMVHTLLSIPFTVGVPFDFALSQITQVQGTAVPVMSSAGFTSGYFLGEADATHSTYWGGIQSVVIDGKDIDYSIASASGTDWRQSFTPAAVPEPDTAALFVAGLILVLLVSQRKAVPGPGSINGLRRVSVTTPRLRR